LLSNLMLLRAMAGGCDDQGHFLGIEDMAEDGRNFLHYTAAMMSAQLGTTNTELLPRVLFFCLATHVLPVSTIWDAGEFNGSRVIVWHTF